MDNPVDQERRTLWRWFVGAGVGLFFVVVTTVVALLTPQTIRTWPGTFLIVSGFFALWVFINAGSDLWELRPVYRAMEPPEELWRIAGRRKTSSYSGPFEDFLHNQEAVERRLIQYARSCEYNSVGSKDNPRMEVMSIHRIRPGVGWVEFSFHQPPPELTQKLEHMPGGIR